MEGIGEEKQEEELGEEKELGEEDDEEANADGYTFSNQPDDNGP